MRVYYPKEYTMQEYENYNFTVLQLYDDLTDSYGYVGLKTLENIEEDQKYTVYGYTIDNQQGSFNLRSYLNHGKQSQDQGRCLGSGVLLKENGNKYYIVGLKHQQRKEFMSEKIRNRMNQWTEYAYIDLDKKNIEAQRYKYLNQTNWTHLTKIYLNLCENKIDIQGFKYLSQANWTHLIKINLTFNKIGAQGCKYLSQTNWPHLTTINLCNNKIGTQGCKYLSQANWMHLIYINLNSNNIGAQGCKYLSQTNWKHLTTIYLYNNNIGAQGCKYLSQTNWKHLTAIDLSYNNINDIIYRLLLQQSYRYN